MEKVKCEICKNYYIRVNTQHIKKCSNGELNNENEYLERYPNSKLYSDELRKKYNSASLESKVRRYGKEEGTQRYNKYKERQAYTNTFVYKNKKYGMTKDEFEKYNKSRAVTLDNQIEKYGKGEGTQRYNKYKERQAYAGNKLEYFIEKYGKEEGVEQYKITSSKKAITLENYIRLYGKDGVKKYNERIQKMNSGYSAISQEFFWKIYKEFELENNRIYFAELNNEFARMKKGGGAYKYDFVDLDRKICIEFNGTYWHADPREYNSYEYIKFPKGKKILVEDIWKKDKDKQNLLENDGFLYLIVWQKDYTKNEKEVIKKLEKYFKS